MGSVRKNYPAALKVNVALAALKEDKTLAQPFKGDEKTGHFIWTKSSPGCDPATGLVNVHTHLGGEMMLDSVVARFVEKSPVSVMARGLLEKMLNPDQFDDWFLHTAEKQ